MLDAVCDARRRDLTDSVPRVPVRVIICDDAVAFPELVRSWLDESPRTTLAATATTLTELLEIVGEMAPDVVLLDLVLPEGRSSPELVARLRELAPGVRIVLISSMPITQLAQEAARTGADAYCPKAVRPDDLLAAVTG